MSADPLSNGPVITVRTSVPQVERAAEAEVVAAKSGSGLIMMACCAAMVGAFGYVILTAPAGQSWGASALTALPLLACVGAHLVMHKLIGKSCHGSAASGAQSSDENSKGSLK